MNVKSLLFLFALLLSCGNSGTAPDISPVEKEITWQVSPASLSFTAQTATKSVLIVANDDWMVASGQLWCTTDRTTGFNGQTVLKVTVTSNPAETARNTELTLSSGKYSAKIPVSQEGAKIESYVPESYTLKWQDEFNAPRLSGGKPALPNADKWWYENLPKGAVNNELQTYVGGFRGTDTVAAIHDGTLKIIAQKSGGDIISARINTKESWQYGYFEARLKMPSGKGTWPAFWMMPKNFTAWPLDGEIDIMEYVGYDPGWVHASVHTKAYNHTIGTQKTARMETKTAETEFHIYAVEWTADFVKGFVDGVEYFRFDNDKKGDVNTWPFNKPFYLKLNLAWGGDWGGAQGVDETKLPATYEIDYVRVYQK